MCTGTPHCGSGVQAGDELLIPTSSNLAPPFSFLPPSLPPSQSQLCCRQFSSTPERHVERRKKDSNTSLNYASLGGLKTHAGSGGQHQLRTRQTEPGNRRGDAGAAQVRQGRSEMRLRPQRRRMLPKQGSDRES